MLVPLFGVYRIGWSLDRQLKSFASILQLVSDNRTTAFDMTRDNQGRFRGTTNYAEAYYDQFRILAPPTRQSSTLLRQSGSSSAVIRMSTSASALLP